MPTYEYACSSCQRRFEIVQRFADEPLETCEECGGALRRVFHPVGIVLKGSGFYATDNRGGKALNPSSKDGSKESGSGSSESKSSESKTSESTSSGDKKSSEGKKSTGGSESSGSSTTKADKGKSA